MSGDMLSEYLKLRVYSAIAVWSTKMFGHHITMVRQKRKRIITSPLVLFQSLEVSDLEISLAP
jgi:hypothetical protein